MRQLLYFCVTPYKICEMRCNSFKFNVWVNNSFPYHAYSFVAMGFCPITTSLNGTFTVEGNMLVSRRFPHICHVFISSSHSFVYFLATTASTPFLKTILGNHWYLLLFISWSRCCVKWSEVFNECNQSELSASTSPRGWCVGGGWTWLGGSRTIHIPK